MGFDLGDISNKIPDKHFKKIDDACALYIGKHRFANVKLFLFMLICLVGPPAFLVAVAYFVNFLIHNLF